MVSFPSGLLAFLLWRRSEPRGPLTLRQGLSVPSLDPHGAVRARPVSGGSKPAQPLPTCHLAGVQKELPLTWPVSPLADLSLCVPSPPPSPLRQALRRVPRARESEQLFAGPTRPLGQRTTWPPDPALFSCHRAWGLVPLRSRSWSD